MSERRRIAYSEEEIQILKDTLDEKVSVPMELLPHRSKSSLQTKRYELKAARDKTIVPTEKEKEVILKYYRVETAEQIKKRLGMSNKRYKGCIAYLNLDYSDSDWTLTGAKFDTTEGLQDTLLFTYEKGNFE